MTNAELAILSLVAERPLHGYEIEQIIEARGMRDWTEVGFSSIYYLLRKLEQAGLVQGQIEEGTGRGPARRVYRITAAGRAAWREAVLQALAAPRRGYSSFLLGLANLPGLPRDEALAALRAYREALRERRAQIRAAARAQRPLPFVVEALFDYSLALIGAELSWVKRFITRLEEQDAKD